MASFILNLLQGFPQLEREGGVYIVLYETQIEELKTVTLHTHR